MLPSRLTLSSIIILLVTNCAPIPHEAVRAPDDIIDSFIITHNNHNFTFTGNKLNNSNSSSPISTKIGIYKSSLDKEYLLQGSMISQPVVANFENLKSRIVAFKKRDNTLYMLEATQGHTISTDLPQNLVLAAFPIIKEDNNTIFFDFIAGMQKMFIAGDWNGQDFSGSSYSLSWDHVELAESYLEEATIDQQRNLVTIRQIAQMVVPNRGIRKQTPVEVKYYLQPYRPSKTFKPHVSTDFDKMGFFEIAPQHLPGQADTVIYASKFNENKSITFAISSNTPKEYRQAVQDGILYWNKAFKKQVLKAIDAPFGVTAPHYDYNIVQWVDWEDAGFAYADAQMDPRTGEILHAQVFMTSVFAFSGKEKARRLLRRLRLKQKSNSAQNTHQHRRLGLNGFKKQPMCNFDPSNDLIQSLSKLLERTDITDDRILKVSQDYVREVVAHEIGHTLGLRHNFAGSLHSNIPTSTKKSIHESYLRTGKTPSQAVPSSSVMDYHSFDDGTLIGDLIARSNSALPYDYKVIQELYHYKKYHKKNIPAFCTDSHKSNYWDCNTFDSGSSLIESIKVKEQNKLRLLPYIMIEQYIATKSMSNRKLHLKNALLSPLQFAAYALSGRKKILDALTSNLQVLSIRRKFDYIHDINYHQVTAAEREYIHHKIQQSGGLKKLLQPVSDKHIEESQQLFNDLLNKEEIITGKGPHGISYQLTYADRDMIKKQGKEFFSLLKQAYPFAELMILNQVNDLYDGVQTDNLANIMSQRAHEILFATNDNIVELVIDQNQKVTTISLPKYMYSTKLRKMAAQLLSSRSSENQMWGKNQKFQLKATFIAQASAALGEDIRTASVNGMPKKIGNWILDNRDIYLILR